MNGVMQEIIKQSVGIDISKDTFTACVCRKQMDQEVKFSKSKVFDNNKPGFKEFIKWVKAQTEKKVELFFIMEATGIYYENLAYYLHEQSFNLNVTLPNKSKNYFKSLNIKSKTDGIDARGLSQFGAERKFPAWEPPSEFFRQLRSLTRHINRLNEEKTAFQNMLHSNEYSYGSDKIISKSSRSIIKKLETEIEKLTKTVKELIAANPEIKEKINKLCSIKGVGLKTAASVVAETLGFHQFRSIKQLTSFAGYDIVENSSGTSVRGKTKISKRGNKYIRKALYFPALSATRHCAALKKVFDRILDRRHIKMVSYVAIQRKLLVLMYTLWKKDEMFDETKVAPN